MFCAQQGAVSAAMAALSDRCLAYKSTVSQVPFSEGCHVRPARARTPARPATKRGWALRKGITMEDPFSIYSCTSWYHVPPVPANMRARVRVEYLPGILQLSMVTLELIPIFHRLCSVVRCVALAG